MSKILQLFVTSEILDASEDFTSYMCKFSGKRCNIDLNKSIFNEFHSELDLLKITLYPLDSNAIQISGSNHFENDNFYSEFNSLEDTDIVEIKIDIVKNSKDKIINIYSIELFSKYLSELNFQDRINCFNERVYKNKFICFVSDEIGNIDSSGRIFFRTIKEIESFEPELFISKNLISKIDKISGYTKLVGLKSYILTPLDLDIPIVHNSNLKKAFDEILLISLFGVLYDFTTLDKSNVATKLNGYKHFSFEIDANSLELSSVSNYMKIFSWVFETNNSNDKIGLARNIISLNLKEAKGYNINSSAFDSTKSAFEIYEKQNVKQYIELRNRISDQILSYNEKANKIIESFASNFQKSVLGFISLFSTIVITRVLSSRNFENIFSKDSLIITFIFLGASLIYMFISLWEVNAQKNRFVSSYQNMKNRNLDLLIEDDINKILNNDEEHKADLKFIKQKRSKYLLLWCIVIFAFSVSTIFLYLNKSNVKPNNTTHKVNADSCKGIKNKLINNSLKDSISK